MERPNGFCIGNCKFSYCLDLLSYLTIVFGPDSADCGERWLRLGANQKSCERKFEKNEVLVLRSVAPSCPTVCGPIDCSPPGSSVHGDSSGKSTGVGCHFLLQGNFRPRNGTQICKSPALEVDSLPLSYQGFPLLPSGLCFPHWTETLFTHKRTWLGHSRIFFYKSP